MIMEWTIDNYLQLLFNIGMLVGGVIALLQWRSSIKIRRTEFLDEILNKLWFDEDMAKTMYTIDYNQNWYTQDFHSSYSEFGYQVDKLLSYVDYICYLYRRKNISTHEFNVVKNEINVICACKSTQTYLWNAYHFKKENCSFLNIIDYGIKNNILSKDFMTNNETLYCKHLRF